MIDKMSFVCQRAKKHHWGAWISNQLGPKHGVGLALKGRWLLFAVQKIRYLLRFNRHGSLTDGSFIPGRSDDPAKTVNLLRCRRTYCEAKVARRTVLAQLSTSVEAGRMARQSWGANTQYTTGRCKTARWFCTGSLFLTVSEQQVVLEW